jgi:hypothetical protein
MTKPALGVLVGAGLGLLDGLSAWAYPEARAMIVSIVISSTVKGIVTGAATGWLARRWRSMAGGIAAGIGIGLVLSTAAAVPVMSEQPSRYFDIVLPGMLLGAIVGFVTERYPAGGGETSGRRAFRSRCFYACFLRPSLVSSPHSRIRSDPSPFCWVDGRARPRASQGRPRYSASIDASSTHVLFTPATGASTRLRRRIRKARFTKMKDGSASTAHGSESFCVSSTSRVSSTNTFRTRSPLRRSWYSRPSPSRTFPQAGGPERHTSFTVPTSSRKCSNSLKLVSRSSCTRVPD